MPEFQDLPANTTESIALVLTEKVIPPKGVIYYQGSEVEELFFVQQGRIKVAGLTQMRLMGACGCTVMGLGKQHNPPPPPPTNHMR